MKPKDVVASFFPLHHFLMINAPVLEPNHGPLILSVQNHKQHNQNGRKQVCTARFRSRLKAVLVEVAGLQIHPFIINALKFPISEERKAGICPGTHTHTLDQRA